MEVGRMQSHVNMNFNNNNVFPQAADTRPLPANPDAQRNVETGSMRLCDMLREAGIHIPQALSQISPLNSVFDIAPDGTHLHDHIPDWTYHVNAILVAGRADGATDAEREAMEEVITRLRRYGAILEQLGIIIADDYHVTAYNPRKIMDIPQEINREHGEVSNEDLLRFFEILEKFRSQWIVGGNQFAEANDGLLFNRTV